jgi:hypothetical protein
MARSAPRPNSCRRLDRGCAQIRAPERRKSDRKGRRQDQWCVVGQPTPVYKNCRRLQQQRRYTSATVYKYLTTGSRRLSGGEAAGLDGKRKRSRPISRVLSRAIIHLGYASPHTSSDLPGSLYGPYVRSKSEDFGRVLPYLVLLQAGFAVPPSVTTGAVRSYRTLSPLPPPYGGLAVCFLLHFPWTHVPQALPGALPLEPGLSSTLARSDCLADSGAHSGG